MHSLPPFFTKIGPSNSPHKNDFSSRYFEITVLESRVLLSLLAAPLAPSHIESEREAADDATEAPHSNMHQAAVAPETPESKLRAWVDARYVHVPLREKDGGTKLTVLYAAYAASSPPVHAKVLGRNTFAKMRRTAQQ